MNPLNVADGTGVSPAWYAAYVRSRAEDAVCRAFENKGIQAFSPQYSERVRWSDRWEITRRCLFPGYVFIRADLTGGLPFIHQGLIHIVGSDKPTPIDGAEIEALRTITSLGVGIEPTKWFAGQKVYVHSGPFRGMSARVDHTRGERLVVSIDLLQRAVAVNLDPSWIKAYE